MYQRHYELILNLLEAYAVNILDQMKDWKELLNILNICQSQQSKTEKKMFQICSKSTIASAFIVNFEQISHIILVFPLLSLIVYILPGAAANSTNTMLLLPLAPGVQDCRFKQACRFQLLIYLSMYHLLLATTD